VSKQRSFTVYGGNAFAASSLGVAEVGTDQLARIVDVNLRRH
jgi:hypothetical protein